MTVTVTVTVTVSVTVTVTVTVTLLFARNILGITASQGAPKAFAFLVTW